MKDKFREIETNESKNYWRNVLAIFIFIKVTILLTIFIPDQNPGYMEIKLAVNLLILGIQGIYLRVYITTTRTFLDLMK